MKAIYSLFAVVVLAWFNAAKVDAQSYFINSAPIVINDSTNPPAKASPYPSVVNVSGLSGLIDSVSVTLSNVNHTFPDDIGVLLVGPQGESVVLMADAGGGVDITNLTLTFSDFAAGPLPNNTTILPASYQPSVYGNHLWPAPAPTGPYATNLSAFHGTPPNGTWSLFVIDDAMSDSGAIANGWRLTIITAQDPAPLLNNVSVTPVLSENGVATLTGDILDPNGAGSLALSLNWGDAITNQNLSLPQGTTNFLLTHRYLDDGQKGSAVANYRIGLTLTDAAGVSDDGFFSALFQDLLGRPYDPEQRSVYENKVMQFGRSNFAYDLLTSLEYRGRKVQDYYQQFLYHSASAGDQNFIALSAMKEREIVSFILASTDYFQNRANNDNSAWLDSVYYDLLKRPASAAEKSAYLSFIIQNGRGPAADSLLASAEFRQLQVETWVQKFLHHTGGASAPPFVTALSNQTWEQVLALLLGSTDYYNGRSGGTASFALTVAVTNVPPSLSNLGIGSPIVEGGITSVSGQFSDPGSQDACTLKINWGDGSPLQTIASAVGQSSFNVAHLYSVPHTTNLVQLTMSDDDGGAVTSNLTVVVKERLPTITAVARQPGSITRLTCVGVPARTYTVQASPSLSNSTNWVNLGGATASANGTFTTYDMAPGNASERFYRLRSP